MKSLMVKQMQIIQQEAQSKQEEQEQWQLDQMAEITNACQTRLQKNEELNSENMVQERLSGQNQCSQKV